MTRRDELLGWTMTVLLAAGAGACSVRQSASLPVGEGTGEGEGTGDGEGGGEGEGEGQGEGAGEGEGEGESEGTGGEGEGEGARDEGSGGADAGPQAGDANGSCAGAADCRGEVCDPASNLCVPRLPCARHDQCGLGAHCDTAVRLCVPSQSGSPCATSDNCAGTDSCADGYCGCGGAAYSAEIVAPNVLIVLDRSTSMTDRIGNSSKWEIAKAAIANLLAATGGDVRYGLALYPGQGVRCADDRGCNGGAVVVDPAPGNTLMINRDLSQANTCRGTPIAETLEGLLRYDGLADAARANYVLLITDGKATCADPVPVVSSLRDLVPEVKTFVVGFGAQVDAAELNSMALAGGTAVGLRPPHYFVASDAASLAAALSSIAGSVLSCTYTLSDMPADLDDLYVYEDGAPVSQDGTRTDGWAYDAAHNQITFYGPACDGLKSGDITDLTIVYGCKRPAGQAD